MGVVSRVQKQLDRRDRDRALSGNGGSSASLAERVKAIGTKDAKNDDNEDEARGAEVLLLGSGRAIEKTLAVAVFLMRRPELHVSIRTGSAGTTDDIIEAPPGDEGGAWAADDGFGEDYSRSRTVSCVEVGVSLRE